MREVCIIAECPFYIRHSKKLITCEDTCRMYCPEEVKSIVINYCSSSDHYYKQCEIYKIITSWYDKEDQLTEKEFKIYMSDEIAKELEKELKKTQKKLNTTQIQLDNMKKKYEKQDAAYRDSLRDFKDFHERALDEAAGQHAKSILKIQTLEKALIYTLNCANIPSLDLTKLKEFNETTTSKMLYNTETNSISFEFQE